MRKQSIVVAVIALALVATIAIIEPAFAGNAGVTDPTVTVTERTRTGGQEHADAIRVSLASLETAVEAAIDQLDATAIETGSTADGATNTFTLTYTVAPIVIIEQKNATTNAYATSVTTSNFVASVPGGTTNNYVVIPLQ